MAPDRRNYLGGLCSLLTLLCSLVLTQAAPQDVPSAASFYVDSIPGITQDPNNPLKIFAGHLSADPDFPKAKATDVTSHVYFVMIKNRRLADKRRVMFWFNGGPGCSSFDGLMMEVGPWRMDGKGGFKVQEGGWEEYMTMVYVDQPAGTGFSYTSTDKYVHTVKEIQDQFMEFLRNFYLVFPEYKSEDTYLGGESFAGQWIPYFADAILGSNMHIPLKGVAIGNGWIDPRRQYATYIDFAVKVGLIEENSNAWKVARKQTDECVAVMNKEKGKEPMQWHGCEGLVQAVVVSKNHKKDDKNMCLNIYDVRLEDTSPACGMNWPPDMKPITDFLGHKDVVRAIHAEAHSEAWIECRRDVHRAFHEKTENASITIVPKVLEKIPILIFAGDQDLICNYVGLEAMIKEMSWNGATGLGTVETQNWSVNNTAAGTWVTSRNLTYAKIFNASHMVPYDVPFVAHDMIQRFAGFNFSAINSGTALIPSSLGTKKKPVFVGQADAKPTTLPNAGKTPEQDKAMWEAYYNAGSAALVLLVIFTAIGSFVWCRHRRRPVQLPVRQNDDESIPLRPTDQDEEDEELEGMRQQKGKMRARDPSNPPIFDVGDDEDDVPHKHGGHRV